METRRSAILGLLLLFLIAFTVGCGSTSTGDRSDSAAGTEGLRGEGETVSDGLEDVVDSVEDISGTPAVPSEETFLSQAWYIPEALSSDRTSEVELFEGEWYFESSPEQCPETFVGLNWSSETINREMRQCRYGGNGVSIQIRLFFTSYGNTYEEAGRESTELLTSWDNRSDLFPYTLQTMVAGSCVTANARLSTSVSGGLSDAELCELGSEALTAGWSEWERIAQSVTRSAGDQTGSSTASADTSSDVNCETWFGGTGGGYQVRGCDKDGQLFLEVTSPTGEFDILPADEGQGFFSAVDGDISYAVDLAFSDERTLRVGDAKYPFTFTD